jgi:Legionella pneumophila major outer membrane protein precursor
MLMLLSNNDTEDVAVKRLMRKVVAIAIAGVAMAQPVQAQMLSGCGICGDFTAGAHALYWKPSHCAYEYARTEAGQGNPSIISVSDIKADYEWGFRVFGGYAQGCFYSQLSYQWLQTTDNATANQAEAIGLSGGNNQVRGRLFYEYQNIDIRAGQYLHHGRGCHFSVFGNVRWVDLKRNNRIEGLSEAGVASWTQKAKFDGAGLGVGTAGEFCLWQGLNGFGEFNLMGLIGDRKTPLHQTTSTAGAVSNVRFSSNNCVIPAMDFRVGLNYTFDCWCSTFGLEVGYEMNYYWNALEYEAPTGTNTTGVRECFDVGFAGPYIGGRVTF